MTLANWLREHAIAGATLDPDAPLTDLEPLGDLIGDARVVAIGENQHHVREFYLLRHRLLRFLAERRGFSVYALEAPFTDGPRVDAWVRGGPGTVADVTSAGVALELGDTPEFHDLLSWMRVRNEVDRDAGPPLRFAGVDLPGSLGSPLSALDDLEAFLRVADPGTLPLLDHARDLVQRYHDPSALAVLEHYAVLDQADRDAVTVVLTRLLSRLEILGAEQRRSGRGREHATALHRMRGAWQVDLTHRDVMEYGTVGLTMGRDRYLAESVLHLLEDGGPETRIVLACHNWHIQRAPTEEEGIRVYPQGYHLAEALGEDYLAIGVTSGGGLTTVAYSDPEDRGGPNFRETVPPPPVEGSVEAAFRTAFEYADAPAGHAEQVPRAATVAFADLRTSRNAVDEAELPVKLRMSDYFLDVPVAEAFDVIAYVPETRGTEYTRRIPQM